MTASGSSVPTVRRGKLAVSIGSENFGHKGEIATPIEPLHVGAQLRYHVLQSCGTACCAVVQQKKRSSHQITFTTNMFSVALLLLAAGSCVKCEQLTQPASANVQSGQRLTISCQVSYSMSSYATAWIRQPAGKGLEWIGWKYTGGSNYKDSLKNKFSISLDTSSNTVTLNGQNLQPEDSAVYYCARDPQ
ncbi:hypothetical protein CRENBAI_020972 [Crenichthys baileyi]|uniref:Ig-like domain-containing protein n=1 Tax=Crenichthys baileyi TaxID=28760 RepID=A0AAV9RDB9_9TELE